MPRPQAVAPLASPDEIEQQLYDALRHGDIERLMAVWSDDDEISCVHPDGTRVVGTAAIRAAFTAIFEHGSLDVQPEKVRRLETHACSVHAVLEHIRVMAPDGPQSAWVVATNVYLKTAQGWRLVAHHASPGSPHEAHERVDAGTVLH